MTQRITMSELMLKASMKAGPKYVVPENADLTIREYNNRSHQYSEYFNNKHLKSHDKHRDTAASRDAA